MVISGAVAGLIGMPLLFGSSHSYGTTFQSGIGFAGIAVALLGRNNPVGIAVGALLFSYLSEQSNLLEINAQVSPDIVAITQGVIVLTVVIAYEVVRRYRTALEQQRVAAELSSSAPAERDLGGDPMTVAPDELRPTGTSAAPAAPRRISIWIWVPDRLRPAVRSSGS